MCISIYKKRFPIASESVYIWIIRSVRNIINIGIKKISKHNQIMCTKLTLGIV